MFSFWSEAAPRTEDILNKRNRRLEPPPRNIKSNQFNPDERFEVAYERSTAALSGTSIESSDDSYNVLLGSHESIQDRSVALGIVAGGSSGVIGAKVDVAVPYVWVGGLIGSGVDYTAWSLGVKKFLFPSWAVLPFVDLKYTEWMLKKSEKQDVEYPFPAYATKKFFRNAYDKQTAHLLTPSLGVAYVAKDGFSFEVAAQYLWSFDTDEGAVLGSLGLVKYF